MTLTIIGLGRMGANMARRLMGKDIRCVVFDLDSNNATRLCTESAEGAHSLEDLARRLSTPRTLWLMVPVGEAVEKPVTCIFWENYSPDAMAREHFDHEPTSVLPYRWSEEELGENCDQDQRLGRGDTPYRAHSEVPICGIICRHQSRCNGP